MADEDVKESSTPKPVPMERPKSARAKKKQGLANLDLIMSGLKTDKEKLLARMLQAQIKKTNEKEGEMRKLAVEMRQASAKVSELEKTAKTARNAVYKEQKLRTSAITEQQQVYIPTTQSVHNHIGSSRIHGVHCPLRFRVL